jgi:hypothetical protein
MGATTNLSGVLVGIRAIFVDDNDAHTANSSEREPIN